MEILNKKTLKNYIYNLLSNIVNVIFPLITYPYVLRIFNVEDIGIVNFANSIVTYFAIIAGFGLPIYGIKIIAQNKGDSLQLRKSLTELMTIKLIITSIMSILYIIIITVVGAFRNNFLIYFLLGIQLFSGIISCDWFYQGMEKFKYLTKRLLLVKILNLLLTFLLIKSGTNIIIYALITSLSVMATYLIDFLNLRKYVKLYIKTINIKQHIKPLSYLLISAFATASFKRHEFSS
jgi:O-antigen/teichoic acid export membrane protein